MELVESFLAAQQEQAAAINFENLVDDMMDLDIGSKVLTTEHIADLLNTNGWSLMERLCSRIYSWKGGVSRI